MLVCPVDAAGPPSSVNESWLRTRQACTPVTSTARTSVRLDQADGNSHVAIAFDGTWNRAVTVKSVGVSYEAVDDHFYVSLAVD
jgi:hypothetical protein